MDLLSALLLIAFLALVTLGAIRESRRSYQSTRPWEHRS